MTAAVGVGNVNTMRMPLAATLAWTLLVCAAALPAGAAETTTDEVVDLGPTAGEDASSFQGLSQDPDDPANLLKNIRERRTETDSLFPASPLHGVHAATDRLKRSVYDAMRLDLGLAYNQLFMGVTESLPGSDDWATASGLDFVGTWELLHSGQPTQGQVFFHFQGRWDWGTVGPENLGTIALGSLGRPGNTFAAYTPTFLPVRNLYWQQGGKEAGWAYRFGKITPDAILGTSAHVAAPLTFTSTSALVFVNALPDSGLGAAAVWFFNDRVKLSGLVSDANGDRRNWGDISEGDFFYAAELAAKFYPRTAKSGWSKLTIWHTNGTDNGQASNGNLGPDGWGFQIKLEQELTADGRAIGIVKYGESYNDSALYKHQGNVLFLYYDPSFIGHIRNDVVGIGLNYVDPALSDSRDEYDLEVFYRFPIFPLVDVTFSYHSIFFPSLDRNNDQASAFGLKLRTTF